MAVARLIRRGQSRRPPGRSFPGERRSEWPLRTTLAVLVLAGLSLSGCTPEPKTILVVESISAIDSKGDAVGDLFSDVCTGSPYSCTVVNDNALVTMSARAENPYTDVSTFGDIVIDRYRVTYVRADGRNTPGTDVPYSFDGAINFRVPVGVPAGQPFMVVRQQAKLEPPLRDLARGGGSLLISVIAQIDFYGRNIVTDRAVSARASLNITFADFGDK